ncbi:bola-like protein [Clavulina sp. PMI_390]|nr:bola-like protein [Clavulina sp. PMI_390]
MSTVSTAQPGPVETSIRTKLVALLAPNELVISNDSWKHAHHAAMKAPGAATGETHFNIKVVSEVFSGKTTMQRHRLIYGALSEELNHGLHALSLTTRTPTELQK